MRTLIIDNYDSFTNNLFHYLAELTDVAPTIVRNDDPEWTIDRLAEFDNVVISPGPGRPQRGGDFGICADVIRHASLPVLGVCLGHQGICHLYGGSVELAPEPFHGQVSAVWHDREDDILRGIPSPFNVVRYHSLAARDLPAQLRALAWTDDGVLMAVRHRTLPRWGVQFHPESIGTEYGHQVLANFLELGQRESGGAVHVSPILQIGAEPAPEPLFTVVVEELSSAVDTGDVFAALYAESEYGFWLDSTLRDVPQGRFSIMGDTSGPLARIAKADVWERSITVITPDGSTVHEGRFFDWLDADLRAHPTRVPDLPFDFGLGWVGYLGYELKAECGGELVHRSAHPDAVMLFVDRAIVFDHDEHKVYLLALAPNTEERPARDWISATRRRLAVLTSDTSGPGADPESRFRDTSVWLRHDKARYLGLIEECQQEIVAGETYEVCLTNMVSVDAKFDPVPDYLELRTRNAVPFGALLKLDDLAVLSCSPERFVSVSTTGAMESKPIKGTRPRSTDPDEDQRLKHDLATSEKDRAENLMIVDLVRHDLGGQARIGSVHVDRLFDVETFSTVHQVVSTVRAQLLPGSSAVQGIKAAFPGGSMTGAPKIRTMQIIDRLEQGPRGVYSGALGYFSLNGAAEFSIVIRTLVVGDETAEFGVGGAIIALSDPDVEFEETAVKATALLRFIGKCFPE